MRVAGPFTVESLSPHRACWPSTSQGVTVLALIRVPVVGESLGDIKLIRHTHSLTCSQQLRRPARSSLVSSSTTIGSLQLVFPPRLRGAPPFPQAAPALRNPHLQPTASKTVWWRTHGLPPFGETVRGGRRERPQRGGSDLRSGPSLRVAQPRRRRQGRPAKPWTGPRPPSSSPARRFSGGRRFVDHSRVTPYSRKSTIQNLDVLWLHPLIQDPLRLFSTYPFRPGP